MSARLAPTRQFFPKSPGKTIGLKPPKEQKDVQNNEGFKDRGQKDSLIRQKRNGLDAGSVLRGSHTSHRLESAGEIVNGRVRELM